MTTRVNKDEEKWQTCTAKRLLTEDILTGLIPGNMPAKEVYELRPEYKATEWRLFSSRLRSLRKQIETSKQQSNNDAAALLHDCQLYPKKTHNELGLPNWDGSAAQTLLKTDIDNNRHTELKPKELYATRAEYQIFTLKVFRGHIHQEVKRRKFLTQYASRNKRR